MVGVRGPEARPPSRRAPAGRAAETQTWERWLEEAFREIQETVPDGEALILVDEERWAGANGLSGRRRIPFLERDGEYWGLPADDATAVRELERLRREGAAFLVIGWPSFWWLAHYPEFHGHLLQTARKVLESRRIQVFDLRQAEAR
jgi:hypothetical protein